MFHFSQTVLWLHSDAIPAGGRRERPLPVYIVTAVVDDDFWLVGGVGSTGVLPDPRRFRVTMVTKP